ncbi:MAG TPA: hypothetical protein VF624_06325, partial [Tepidisphaeraceae bacterium]
PELVEQSERRLKAVYVESTVRLDQGSKEFSPIWTETAEYGTGRAWLNGRPGGPCKVFVDRDVTQWLEGSAPYYETKLQVHRDRGITTILQQATGPVGRTVDPRTAIVTSRSDPLSSIFYFWGTGAVFTANHRGGVTGDARESLSQELKERIKTYSGKNLPEGVVPILEVTEDKINGRDCVRLTIGVKGQGHESWWFDPQLGFNYTRYERVLADKYLSRRINVSEFAKSQGDVWYPSKAEFEIWRLGANEKSDAIIVKDAIRYRYHANKVVVNEDHLERELTDPLILPAGTQVKDEIEKRDYVVAPPDDQATKEVDKALSDAIKAATQPATSPSKKIEDRP